MGDSLPSLTSPSMHNGNGYQADENRNTAVADLNMLRVETDKQILELTHGLDDANGQVQRTLTHARTHARAHARTHTYMHG